MWTFESGFLHLACFRDHWQAFLCNSHNIVSICNSFLLCSLHRYTFCSSIHQLLGITWYIVSAYNSSCDTLLQKKKPDYLLTSFRVKITSFSANFCLGEASQYFFLKFLIHREKTSCKDFIGTTILSTHKNHMLSLTVVWNSKSVMTQINKGNKTKPCLFSSCRAPFSCPWKPLIWSSSHGWELQRDSLSKL